MVQTQFADLTSGYERFDALKKNLEGIFEKVYQMKEYKLDISYYERKFEDFKKEFKLKDDFLQSSKMPFEGMQKDYEMMVLTDCNKSLERLTIEFEENVTPIYNIYLLFNAIDVKLNNEDDDDIDEVIKQTILLIDQINGIYSHNKIEVTRLVERAYETIYDALLYEEVYSRHDILDYLKRKNLSSNRENLGKVLRERITELQDQGALAKGEVDEEFIDHMDEGLGYDYLSNEFLSTLSRKSLIMKQQRMTYHRQQMEKYIDDVVDDFQNRQERNKKSLRDSKRTIRNLRVNRAAIKGKVLALVLVPMLALGAGNVLGKSSSEKITEYATTTRVVDMNTGSVIGEPNIVYDEKGTTYVATVTIYEPWRRNPTGVGYIRNAVAYEYILPEDVSEDYHISKEDIVGNVREKYRFNEPKDVLDENDSMTDSVIYVTETYQDKTNSRKSSKYIIPFTIIGGVLGAGIDVALLFTGLLDLERIKRRLEELREEIQDEKKDAKRTKNELLKMKNEAESIMADKKRIEEKYGITVETPVLVQQKKR